MFHCPDWVFDLLIDCVVKRGQETKYDLGLNPYDLWRNFINYPTISGTFFTKTFFNRRHSYLTILFDMLHFVSVWIKPLSPWGLTCKMHRHVLSRHESLNALESFSLTPDESVWNKGVSFYLYHAFIILHPTTDLCHGNAVSLLHCWFQSGPEGLVS